MHAPPVTQMAKWHPNHWITESGYALNALEIVLGHRGNTPDAVLKTNAAREATNIIREVMAK